MTKNNQKGFSVVEIVIVLIVLVGIGLVGYKVLGKKETNKTQPVSSEPTAQPQAESSAWPTAIDVKWENSGDERGWISLSNSPPACPDPLKLTSPADVSKATSVLYPGQTRGGNYKPHGGLRFDGLKNTDVAVKSSIPGYVYRGGQYLSEGEIQYTFDIINSCGIMIRLGHLRTLSAAFQQIADKFPAATEGDSRSTKVEPVVQVKESESIATEVGIRAGTNTFFDFGVYDLRTPNEISKTAAYKQKHADDMELSWHAVCWFDMLPTADTAKAKSLPAGDPTSGKTSDYCK